jgi:Arc/MetJ family transcription regulator
MNVVYDRCMARTNIDIDEHACTVVMRRYGLRTKRETVNFALRELAAEVSADDARRMKGAGWEGDLEELRSARFSRS